MKKIIIVSTVGLIYDGITSVITSYLEAMNREDLKIYVVSTIMSESKIEKKIEELGCEIVQLPSRRKSPIVYFFSLAHFIRKNNIEVIHAHGNSATLSIELLAGFLGGCKRRIAHSHNTRCDQVRADKMLRPLFNLLYTDALACGNEAGLWLFGNRKFKVLKNGRNVKKYSFSLEKRNEMRKRLDISDCIAIGHVGGFFEQKNHKFLIKIFREVLNRKPNAKLFLIGDGPLKDEIMKNVSDIRKSVIFVGTVDNVNDYMQAMDIMVLPSLFEGLPLVAIEWQINGLPSLLSNTITEDCNITNMVRFESLEESPYIWTNDILEMLEKENRLENSQKAIRLVRENGFDIDDNAKILEKIYKS